MDTNVKKFKYSPLFKLICVLLSFACFSGSAFLVLNGITALSLRLDSAVPDKDAPTTWVETGAFRSVTQDNFLGLEEKVTYKYRIADIKKELKNNKDKCVKEAVQKNLKHFSKIPTFEQYKKTYENEVYSDQELLEWYEGDYFTETQSINVFNDSYYYINSFDYTFQNINDEVKLTEYFNKKYDNFLTNAVDDSGYNIYWSAIDNGVNYYAAFKGTVNSSLEEGEEYSEADAMKSDYFIICDRGELKAYGGVPKEVAQEICDNLRSNDSYKKQLYICLYYNDADIAPADIVNLIQNEQPLSLIKYSFDNTQKLYDNFYSYAAVAVALLIISFICAFMYFTYSGRKNDKECARLLFSDYVPLELQLCIIGGAGFGLAILGVQLTDSIANTYCYNLFYAFVTLAVALLCWIMLFCVCASVGRYAHSGKKFYKHLITYWVLFVLFNILKFIFKITKRFFCWIFRRAKGSVRKTTNAFAYKPKKFKRNMIALVCLYLAGNVFLIALDGVFAVAGLGILFAMLTLLIIVGNFLIIRKASAYIKNLDIIIAASEKHEDSGLDTQTLDRSLQILNESMRYTSAELQNAINKAVKDERLRTELITNVSHDLKTPLTSIINYVDLLSRCDIKDDSAKEYITVLTEKSARLKRLIEDLIEASKLSSGNITVNLAPLNLSELCLQAAVDVQSDFEKAGLELVIKQGEKPETVIADGSKTFRVLENLFSNAKKYSAKASRVYVSVYSENDLGIIEIKNISAMPLDISADELTERFVRGDASRNQEGNGLGLSIATELCKAMNGELEIIIDGDLFKARVKLPKK